MGVLRNVLRVLHFSATRTKFACGPASLCAVADNRTVGVLRNVLRVLHFSAARTKFAGGPASHRAGADNRTVGVLRDMLRVLHLSASGAKFAGGPAGHRAGGDGREMEPETAAAQHTGARKCHTPCVTLCLAHRHCHPHWCPVAHSVVLVSHCVALRAAAGGLDEMSVRFHFIP